MIQVPRDDRSVIGQWWWTVDRWSLGAILAIMAFFLVGGALLARVDVEAGRRAAREAEAEAHTV